MRNSTIKLKVKDIKIYWKDDKPNKLSVKLNNGKTYSFTRYEFPIGLEAVCDIIKENIGSRDLSNIIKDIKYGILY